MRPDISPLPTERTTGTGGGHPSRTPIRSLVARLLVAALAGGALMVGSAPAQALENDLALTPPMGWNSWNQVRCYDLNEDVVKAAVDGISARGLGDVGYEYVVVDDCWQGGRDESGALFADPERFPSGMDGIAAYVHRAGLKFGIYSSPGSETCANHWDSYPISGIASLGHEEQDAQTFADWGVDYLKYDWCRADVTDGLERPAAFSKMRDALAKTGRPIVYGISEYGDTAPWTWAAPIANLWRTTSDIQPNWNSVSSIIQSQAKLASYSGPGAWNDPDMLQVGNGTMSAAENRTHFGMWAMLAAPLFLGTDVKALNEQTLAVISNPEIIAIDQDARGSQAALVSDRSGVQVWARQLAGGDIAVALMNTTGREQTIATTLEQIGGTAGSYIVRDAWGRRDLRNTTKSISAQVASHDTAILRLRAGSDAALPGLVSAAGSATIERGASDVIPVRVSNLGGSALVGANLEVAGALGITPAVPSYAVPSVPAGGSVVVDVELSVSDDAALGETPVKATLTPEGEVSVTATVVPPAPQGPAHVSDLVLVQADAAWGEVRKDASVDRQPLRVDGITYAKGLGVHADSTVRVWLGGQCSTLVGGLGIDDETEGGDPAWGFPSITGMIQGDGRTLWDSAGVLGYRESESFTVDVRGVDMLTLAVTDGGDGNAYDHADWLDLELDCAADVPDAGADPQVSLNAGAVKAGGQVTARFSGFTAGSSLRIELRSAPVQLGSVQLDVEGSATATVTVPTGTSPGEHQLVGIDSAGLEAQVALVVTADGLPGAGADPGADEGAGDSASGGVTSAAGLAATGGAGAGPAVALAAMLLALAYVLLRRSGRISAR